MAKANISLSATKLQLANSISLCIGIAFVAQLAPLNVMQSAHAADFSRAKKTFVPPTKIPRRFDSEASSTESDSYSSSSPSSYDPGYTTPSVAKSGKASGKTGLVPPPPPLTPTLLPPSLLHMPAQSSTSSESSSGSVKPSPQRWSVAVQKNLKRAATSPKVASFIDQAQTRAQALVREGKLDQAQELLKTYVKQLPRDPALKSEFAKISVQRAQQLLTDQNIDAAAKVAREALAVQPQNEAAHAVLTQALKKQGLSAGSAADRVKAAKDLLARGKFGDAEMEYNSAVRLKPSADAYVGLGDIAFKSGNKEKAKTEYQKALELEPHSGAALRQMGIIRLGQSDIVGANSDLSRALVVDPNDKVASKHLVDLWQQQVTQNPQTANSHLGLARAHQLSGDLQAAQSEYRKVVEIDPNNTNLPAARQSFKLALARQDARHAVDQAHNLEAAGALQEAHAKVSEAVKLCPGDSAFKLYQAQLGEKLGMTGSGSSSGSLGGLSASAAGLLPGVSPPVAPSFRNGAGQSGLGQAAGAMQEQPPAMALDGIPRPNPVQTVSQVNSMSGFLNSLRTASFQQKQQMQQMEDATNTALKSITEAPNPSGSGAGALGALGALTASSSSPVTSPELASADANLANVNKLLKSIGASSSGEASQHANALGSTASAAAAALGQTIPGASASAAMPATAPSFAPTYTTNSFESFGTPTAKSLSTESTSIGSLSGQSATAKSLGATSAAKKPISKNLAAKPKAGTTPSLADQNKKLQAQLQAAQQQLNALKNPTLKAETPSADMSGGSTPMALSATPAALSAAPSGLSAAPAALSAAPSALSPEIANYGASAAALNNPNVQSFLSSLPASVTSSDAFKTAMANPAAALQTYGASLPPDTQAALQAALKPAIPTGPQTAVEVPASTGADLKPPISAIHPSAAPTTGGGVRLELEGVKPSPMDIKLNVVLHNGQAIPLTVPSTTKAILNMKGEPQRIVKVAFPSKTVPPNGEMHGVIKVPGHNLSPTADLFIPDLLPGQGINSDVHLTVPISFK